MSRQPSITASELARRLGGTLHGDGARTVREVATLEEAGSESVSWIGSSDALARAGESKAGVMLVGDPTSLPADRTVIVVADPDLAICDVLTYLAPPEVVVPPGIHPTATLGDGACVEGAAIGAHVVVEAHAAVGAGTQLHPGVYVGAEAKIGNDCVLWPHVVVRERVALGDRVVVHSNATIGADGFGYLQRDGRNVKIPQIGTVIIEDDVEIGANSTIDRARSGVTRIGRGTKIDNLVQIGHNVEIGEDCIIVAQCGMSGSSAMGNQVMMAGRSGTFDHVRIGNGARIAANTTVTRHVADGGTVRGVPAVDIRRFLRQQASLRHLPSWISRLRSLVQRVERIERHVDDK